MAVVKRQPSVSHLLADRLTVLSNAYVPTDSGFQVHQLDIREVEKHLGHSSSPKSIPNQDTRSRAAQSNHPHQIGVR